MSIKMYNKQVCMNPQQMAKNWETIIFFTQQSGFDFNMNMNILIILKMPFLIRSTILDLMLVLVSVNYFGNLTW